MKDSIRLYFETMLYEGFDLESAKDNLTEIIEEICEEYEENE